MYHLNLINYFRVSSKLQNPILNIEFILEVNVRAREEMKRSTKPHRTEYEMIYDELKTEDSEVIFIC